MLPWLYSLKLCMLHMDSHVVLMFNVYFVPVLLYDLHFDALSHVVEEYECFFFDFNVCYWLNCS